MSSYFQNPDSKHAYSQGDLIEVAPHTIVPSLPLHRILFGQSGLVEDERGDHLAVLHKPAMALIMSADCLIDKPAVKYWQICPVIPLAPLAKDLQNSIRKNKRFHNLHLPAGLEVPESFVDFSVSTTVFKDVIQSARVVVTLTDLARRALYIQHLRHVSRWELNTVVCPECHSEVDLLRELPVRAT